MRVTATKEGFDGQVIRRPGDEFDMPDGASGSWFEPVPAEPKQPKRRKVGAEGEAPPAESDVA